MNSVVSEGTSPLAHTLDNIARILLGIVVLLLPLVVFPTAWIPLPMGKMTILAFGVLIALLLWCVARFNEHRIIFPKTNVFWTALLLVVGYVVAATLSGNLMQSFVGLGFERDTVLSIFVFVAAFATVALTTSKVKHFIRLQQVALAAFFVLAFFQIIRVVVGADVILPTLFSNDATATLLGSWNDLAVFSGLALIMALTGLALFSAKAVRGVLYLVLVTGLFLLVLVNLTPVWAILIIAALLLMVYILTDTFHDQESGTFKPRVPWRRLVPSTIVVFVCIVFLVGGSALGNRISDTFNIAYVDVRPSWEGTSTVGTGALQENLLFGVGPNGFAQAWVEHKPDGVNETNFWNTNFSFGVGFIPTAFITGGLFVGALWILFLISFFYLGFKMLINRATQPAHMYMILSSFLGAGYLWVLSIMYVPQVVMLAYAFILTGVVVAAARIAGIIEVKEIHAQKSYAAGIVVTGVLLVVAVVAGVALLADLERIRASNIVSRAVAAANAGDLARADALASKKISLIAGDSRGAQLRTNIGVAQLTSILNEETEDVEDLRARFQTELTNTISAAQSLVAIDGDDYQSWLLLADVYSSLVPLEIEGAYDSAIEAYGEARARNERSPLIPMSLAQLAFQQGNLEEARTHAEEALTLKSNYTDAFFLISQIDIQENNVTQAISSTESAVVLNPNNTGLLFQLGVLQYSVGEYANAIAVLERAVTLNPNYSNALYYLGLAYEREDNQEGALAAFERIATLNPDNTQVQEIVEALKEGGSALEVLEASASEASEPTELPVSEDN